MDDTILREETAKQIQRDYVCAGCWHRLNVYYLTDTQARVTCDKCGDGRGFVLKTWAEKRKNEDFADASEVKRMLRKFGVIEQQHKTEEELLNDLGF